MTDEELDSARSKEAWRLYAGGNEDVATIAARLARSGWLPDDPDMDDVRAITRSVYSSRGYNPSMEHAEGCIAYELVLKGIRRGRELQREGK